MPQRETLGSHDVAGFKIRPNVGRRTIKRPAINQNNSNYGPRHFLIPLVIPMQLSYRGCLGLYFHDEPLDGGFKIGKNHEARPSITNNGFEELSLGGFIGRYQKGNFAECNGGLRCN